MTRWDASTSVRLSSLSGAFSTATIVASLLSHRSVVCLLSSSCQDLLQDSWSRLGAIHVAYVGLAAHLLILASVGSRRAWARSLGVWTAGIGTVGSAAFLAHAYDLGEFCVWCFASAASFVASLALLLLSSAGTTGRGRAAWERLAPFVVLPFAFFFTQRRPAEERASAASVPPLLFSEAGRPVIGPPGGQRVVLFADLSCPFCREAVPRLVAAIRKGANYRVIFRYLPIESHPYSWEGARCARFALERGRFWDYFLDGSRIGTYDRNTLESLTKRWTTESMKNLTSRRALRVDTDIRADVQLAADTNVHSTPSVVVAELGGITVMTGEDFLHRVEGGP